MKNYAVDYTRDARKSIDKLDKTVRIRVVNWIDNNLVGCENPRLYGTNLVNYSKGNWRYRVGDYRIIADIQDDKVVILVVDVVKRNDAYK